MVHKASTEPKFFATLWQKLLVARTGVNPGERWKLEHSNVTAVELRVLTNSVMVSLSYYPDWIRDQLRDRLLGVLP